MSKLVLNVPGPDEPGFFRRSKKALKLVDELKGNPTAATIEAMIKFLAEYVEGPRDQAEEMLWDASENQIMELVNAITGANDTGPFQETTA